MLGQCQQVGPGCPSSDMQVASVACYRELFGLN